MKRIESEVMTHAAQAMHELLVEALARADEVHARWVVETEQLIALRDELVVTEPFLRLETDELWTDDDYDTRPTLRLVRA